MLERAGKYYVTPYKVHWCVTQGGTLYPTIFNMVVEAFIFHYAALVEREEVVPDCFGWTI